MIKFMTVDGFLNWTEAEIDKYHKELKEEIEIVDKRLRELQKEHRALTGRNHVWFR